MTNRFGFKDFLQIVLLGAIVVLVWLQMVQQDRDRLLQLDVLAKLGAIEKNLASAARAAPATARNTGAPAVVAPVVVAPVVIAPVVVTPVVVAPAVVAPAVVAPAVVAPVVVAPVVDAPSNDAWAVAGVPIEWQEPWSFGTNPRTQPGFEEGGEYTDLFEAQPAKLTPILGGDVYAVRVGDRVCDSLAGWDPNTLRLRGVLASAWQQDPRGLWIRVHLREDARFSDGEPLTADDVRFTFKDYIFNPSIEAERSRSTLDQITDVVVIDRHTVEFKFSKSLSFNLPYTLGVYIIPKHFYSKFEPSQINASTGLLMGSGPYRLERLDPSAQWAPGQDIVLVRNENYWGPRAPLDTLRYRVVTDDLARLVAYTNGEGDQTLPTSPQFVKMTKKPDWSEHTQSFKWINMRSGYSFIAWNGGERNGKPTPFSDVRVRLAMTLCLDRERMIKDIWEGIGIVAKGSVNPESPASDPALKPWAFDPAGGKKLLAEAGWKDRDGDGILENKEGTPFKFEFTRSGGGEIAERIANFVKDAYAKVGIQVEVKVIDWSVMQEIQKARDFDALIMGWSASAPESDPKQIFHSESIKEGGDNFAQWNSPRADKLIDEIRTTLDYDARMRVWHQFEKVLHEEQPYTFVRVAPWLRFVKTSIHNVHPYKTALEPWEFFRVGSLMGSQPVPSN